MEFRGRVFLALLFLLLAKLANVMIPFAMKHIVDALDSSQSQIIAVPIVFLAMYGMLRLGTILFGEIRDTIFGRVTERAMHRIGLKLFKHLHALDLDFHLSRRTGGIARDIDRGTNGINFLMRFMLFNIIPTLLEISLITVILLVSYSAWYALIIVTAVTIYIAYSVILTEKRTSIVRQMNEMDSQTNTRAIDSLLNFETVKYFGNEDYEAEQYDQNLTGWEKARARNRLSMAALNSGQAFVIAASITAIMTLAAYDVSSGKMTLGDLVLVNAYMMQLFIPLNFLGFVYREIKKSLADIEHMFSLLGEQSKIKDKDDAIGLDWTMDIGTARAQIGDRVAIQGNLDTAVLYSTPATIRREVAKILASYGSGSGHVFNLGHGIHPGINPDNVAVLVDAVHELSLTYHR